MKPPRNLRCGKHGVVTNPASQIPVWVPCTIHRGGPLQTRDRFDTIVRLEFWGEEILQLGWIVEHGMLDR